MTKAALRVLALGIVVLAARSVATSEDVEEPKVCSNPELIAAVRIINRACSDASCDFSTLEELDSRVDKPTLLAAFRDPYLLPVHLFFPLNESRIEFAFDWRTSKKSQLDSLAKMSDPQDAVIFVLGQASALGDRAYNIRLSRDRTQSVLSYLRDTLKIRCRTFRGAWFGRDILQLTDSDARLLNLEPLDFRGDIFILNQSVHVFVFPCKPIL